MRYFFKLHDGSRYEIDELDYNNISARIATGRYNGFYAMRGEINKGLNFSFKYFMSLETEGTPKPKDKVVKNIDVDKRKPPEVGKPEEKPKGCQHSWQNPEDWEYVVKNANGKLQYRKQCVNCKKVSPLIKPKEVENNMLSNDKTLADVKQI